MQLSPSALFGRSAALLLLSIRRPPSGSYAGREACSYAAFSYRGDVIFWQQRERETRHGRSVTRTLGRRIGTGVKKIATSFGGFFANAVTYRLPLSVQHHRSAAERLSKTLERSKGSSPQASRKSPRPSAVFWLTPSRDALWLSVQRRRHVVPRIRRPRAQHVLDRHGFSRHAFRRLKPTSAFSCWG